MSRPIVPQVPPYLNAVPNPANVVPLTALPGSGFTDQPLGALALFSNTVYCLTSKTSSTATWTLLGGTSTDVVSGSQQLAVNTTYITDGSSSLVTYTLPATATLGSVIKIIGKSVGGWQIAQNASQQIKLGPSSTTAGTSGSVSSTNANDCLEMVATTGGSSTVWTISNYSGTLTFV